MTKINIARECDELIARFRRLKKAIEEEDSLTPQKRAAAAAAESFARQTSQLRDAQQRQKLPDAETAQAQRLADMLQKSGALGTRPVPRQPTDQELFGHLVPSEQQLAAAERSWGNSFNNWLTEASKPLNSRFKSSEEEEAYWASIKVSSGGGSDSGY